MPESKLKILPMRSEDLTAVYEIETACYPYPWAREHFLQELSNPVATVDLAWIGERLVGYICYWLIAGEMQILNLATAPDHQRMGVAGQLLNSAFRSCRKQGLQRAWLEVRVGNQAAISLYQQYGFAADVVRQNYYRDGENALTMTCDFSYVMNCPH